MNFFVKLGSVKKEFLASTGGRPAVIFWLNKAQTLFLFSVLRNTQKNIEITQLVISWFDAKSKTLHEIIKALKAFDFGDVQERYVYAAQDKAGRIKIGISNNPKKRIKELNLGNPDKLTLVYTKKADKPGYQSEKLLHGKARQYHIRSEWYMPKALKFLT